MKVGFTGTRKGMTRAQHYAFSELVWKLKPYDFHHGACVGADAEAVMVVMRQGWAERRVAHPGKPAAGGDNEFLSETALVASVEMFDPQTHFARNRNIVNACDVLIACPWQQERPAKGTGGGTWFTVEYAERQGKPVHIVWPDGSCTTGSV